MLGKCILPPTDEELGKKDDDHRLPRRTSTRRCPSVPTHFRWRRRRLVLAAVGIYLLYLLLNNLPALGLGDLTTRAELWNAAIETVEEEPKGPPPGAKAPIRGTSPPREYNGQIRFYRLAATLHAASRTGGYSSHNRNVLFAISSFKSASALLPLICEMSRWKRNHVHTVLMGREDIPLSDLLDINGVDQEACPAFWHDARPDYMEYSSEARAESSVRAAMAHIQTFLHPQVVIMDDALSEDVFFVRGLRAKSKALDIPLIQIPRDRQENLMWITRLDAGSLSSWHKPTVDIVIQAPPASSGGLLRLLKSLKGADYAGLNPPRLTIELPIDTDSSVTQYLEGFNWPPEASESDDPQPSSLLTIHRRITNQRITQEGSAVRLLESFYPTSSAHSHVLLLSPDSELSPLYYHYLSYALLEYRYSTYGMDDGASVMGISLERPSVLLDGKTKFKPPSPADMHTSRYAEGYPGVSPQFLWQAPNSHAALLFGDKWVELHSFLSNRIAKQHQTPAAAAQPKAVSELLPAWTEYMLELMRARGYSLLYPATTGTESLVTIHTELNYAPEEFPHSPHGSEKQDMDVADSAQKLLDEPFLRADTPPRRPSSGESAVIPYSRYLHVALPFDGDLPEIAHLPYLLANGDLVEHENVSISASAYADSFRKTVGGCAIPKGKHRKAVPQSARDLFCFGDEDDGDWEDEQEPVLESEDLEEEGKRESVV